MLGYVFFYAFISCVVTTPTSKSLEDIRIVGGDDIEITEAPYQVSLTLAGKHLCGGTIVASDIIVTAAHCISGAYFPQRYRIRVGSSYSEKDGELYPVGEIVLHPNFDFTKMDSDIALIWLSKPLKFNDKVAPLEMVEENEEIADGDLTIVTGWGHITENGGYPTILQRVLVPKVSEKACSDAYQSTYGITSTMLCAGTPKGGKDACQGDSGGPLVYNNKLAGIVSWGVGCARPDYPGVYSKVAALRMWIDDNIVMLRMRYILRM